MNPPPLTLDTDRLLLCAKSQQVQEQRKGLHHITFPD